MSLGVEYFGFIDVLEISVVLALGVTDKFSLWFLDEVFFWVLDGSTFTILSPYLFYLNPFFNQYSKTFLTKFFSLKQIPWCWPWPWLLSCPWLDFDLKLLCSFYFVLTVRDETTLLSVKGLSNAKVGKFSQSNLWINILFFK